MSSTKQTVIEMLNNLPEDVEYDEIMAKIYFKQKVDKSLEQIEDGKVLSHEKAKERLSNFKPVNSLLPQIYTDELG